jgi:hypothetical protein
MLRPRVYSKNDKKVLEVIEIDFDYKVIVVRDIDNSNNNIVGTWCLRDSAPFNNISSIEVLGNEYENKELLKLGITEIKSWSKYKMIKNNLKKI